MIQRQMGIYLGKQPENGFIGFVTNQSSEEKEATFYLVLSFLEGVNQEKGHQIMASIKEEFLNKPVLNLDQLEQLIDEIIKKYNFPAIFSLAAAVLTKEEIAYLKTNGQGCIYLKRGNRLIKIIEGNNSASGYLKEDDGFLLTTADLIKIVDEEKLKKIIDDYSTDKFVEELNNVLINQENQGLIAVLIKFYLIKKQDNEIEEETVSERPLVFENIKTKSFVSKILDLYRSYQEKVGKQRVITLIIALVIIFALIWSVVFGVKRRQEAFKREKIKSTSELIKQKLDQAEEVAYLNLERARVLMRESKEELDSLKKELKIKNNENKEIVNLEATIKEKENKIFRKEEKKYLEFYDLTVDQKQAEGLRLALFEEIMAILDKKQGVIYLLSLTKKSLDKLTDEKIKKTNLITLSKDKAFFYVDNEGLYAIENETKAKKVIDFDKDWREIIDIKSYNNNLYLLDRQKNQIYKYPVTDNGYGDKLNYIKSGSFNFQDANSIMIDSSIYVGFPNFITKFSLGVEDEFANDLPNESIKFNKVYTDKETEKVYGWDRDQGKIYVLTKTGRYERQIYSSILKKATDFVVYNNSAYLLLKEKIFKIDLD